jgi:hypothetical protein
VRIKYLSRTKKDLFHWSNGQKGPEPSKELHACGIGWLRHFMIPFGSGDFSIE